MGPRSWSGLLLTAALVAAPGWTAASEPGETGYADVLARHVDADGFVDYAGLAAGRRALDAHVTSLSRVAPEELAGRGEADRIAFWINAYNALTLRAVIDHYPIRPRLLASLVYPRNSIRQIPGVWDELRFDVAGEARTLEEIEHEVLRREFREPRIHFALVCASVGCPPLRAEPYRGEALEAQLDDQVRRFLADPRKYRLDRRRAVVELSPIFDWFVDDFATDDGLVGDAAVLAFLTHHAPAADRAVLRATAPRIRHLDYDWSLNERRDE